MRSTSTCLPFRCTVVVVSANHQFIIIANVPSSPFEETDLAASLALAATASTAAPRRVTGVVQLARRAAAAIFSLERRRKGKRKRKKRKTGSVDTGGRRK